LSSHPNTRSMVSKRSLKMSALNNGLRPRLVTFLFLGLALMLDSVQANDRSLKIQTHRTGDAHHVWQRRAQQRRFIAVARSGDKRRDDIAVAITEGHDLVTFDLLVSVEADVLSVMTLSPRRGEARRTVV
jgi:hypothetical protein